MDLKNPKFESVWQTGAAFLACFTPGNPAKFLHPIPEGWHEPPHVTVGALLSVVLRFVDRDADFHVHARVISKQLAGPKKGIVLELLREERERLELILTCVAGESFPYFKRRFVRLAARVVVRVTGPGGLEHELVSTSVNEGGMHVAVEPDIPLAGDLVQHARLKLTIAWPSGAIHTLNARLAEVIPAGPQRGIGIEFLFASSEQREAVTTEVALVRAKLGSAP